ncbi:uncharacterized protein LOC120254110 [Dioscorea cayenensis subsp. rotundata]|uniref:Uncharacterized protein LOC120254110 n=1 Tax=Dioscorea cayennensis subsp. rotundata TaxID=55577 RepID=A0AB40AT73_DIOCR|nr:uncharacterized protein LOC120254110 [Dioscorea cayenensis subsp. rotundata]
MIMATISIQFHPSFLTGNPLRPITKLNYKSHPLSLLPCTTASIHHPNHSQLKKDELKLAKLAMVTLAAGVLAVTPVQDATAAKTGGRVGGQAFRSPAPPRSSGPRINNSRTNIFINPPIAPPLVGGYGYGGYGWSPFTFFVPGPSVAVGFGGGFELFAAIVVFGIIANVLRRFTRQRDEDEDDY